MIAQEYVNTVLTSRFFAVRDELTSFIHFLDCLDLENIYKHAGLKFFVLVSWHSKRVKSIWFEIVFQQKQNRLLCTILSNFCLIALANYHASICKFQNIRFCTRWKLITFTLFISFLISRVYIAVMNSPNAPSYLHQAIQTKRTCTEFFLFLKSIRDWAASSFI